MTVVTNEYQELVVDKIKKYKGLLHPKKTSLFERLLVRKVRLERLFPNPEDEFSMPEIGPNYSIIGDYVKKIMFQKQNNLPLFEEPLIAEKRTPVRGYILLNGHHRWMAAHRVPLRRVPVRIVNVTHEVDVLNIMDRSCNTKCASFDLDEVVFAKEGIDKCELRPKNPAYFSRERIRENFPSLVGELKRMGFDIWVYTDSYYSTAYLNKLFKYYGFSVDGIVNGINGKNEGKAIRKDFSGKYSLSVHIDTLGVTAVNTREQEYEIYDLTKEDEWASGVTAIVRDICDGAV